MKIVEINGKLVPQGKDNVQFIISIFSLNLIENSYDKDAAACLSKSETFILNYL